MDDNYNCDESNDGSRQVAIAAPLGADVYEGRDAVTISSANSNNASDEPRGRRPFMTFIPPGAEHMSVGTQATRREAAVTRKRMSVDDLVEHVRGTSYVGDDEEGLQGQVGTTSRVFSENLVDRRYTKRKVIVVACGIVLLVAIIIAAVTGALIGRKRPASSAPMEDVLGPEINDIIYTCAWPDNLEGCGTVIDFSKQRLSGMISPHTIMLATNTTHLDMSENDLTGTIPSELGLLTRLTYLNFAANHLTGTIPTEIGLLSKLSFLRLIDNKIEGSIPSEIGLLTGLVQLDLHGGAMPSEVGLLLNLEFLLLSTIVDVPFDNSRIEEMTIPTEIGLLGNLVGLRLGRTGLTGTIPIEIKSLSSLTALDIFDNYYLTGQLPSEIGQLESLTLLDVTNTPLNGSIPTELGFLTNLTSLSFWGTAMTGVPPSEIGQLTNLRELDLSDMVLSGTFPLQACLLGINPVAMCCLLECSCCNCT